MVGTIRSVHLYLAQGLAGFLVLYAASGLVMKTRTFLPDRGERHQSTVILDADRPAVMDEASAGLLAQELVAAEGHAIRVQRVSRREDGSWRISLRRPGAFATVDLQADGRTASLTVDRPGFATLMNQLHQFHGYGGGWLYDLWALMLDLVSVACLVFAVTGVYLWWKLQRDRLGWWFLGFSTVYSILTCLFLILRA